MNRKIVGIVVSTGIVLAASAGAARAQNSPRGTGIDAGLRGAVERKDVPGVVALVTERRRVLYQGAFGVADASTGRALTADAVFRIASMTKPITSAAAMRRRLFNLAILSHFCGLRSDSPADEDIVKNWHTVPAKGQIATKCDGRHILTAADVKSS